MRVSPEEYEWYKIRDMLFEQNYVKRDIVGALKLAKNCKHSEAQYIANLFHDKDAKTVQEIRNVFLSQPETDFRALCYSEQFGRNFERDINRIRLSAKLGFSLAQANMCEFVDGHEFLNFAQKSASKYERDGFYLLARYYDDIDELEEVEDLNVKSKENYLIAATLGNVNAMSEYSNYLNITDTTFWYWIGKAAKLGDCTRFLSVIREVILCPSSCMFQIGFDLNNCIDYEKKEIFGEVFLFDKIVEPATQAVNFYKFQQSSYRAAVDTWTLVGLHFRVVKDIRILIGKLIWECRQEAEYIKE